MGLLDKLRGKGEQMKGKMTDDKGEEIKGKTRETAANAEEKLDDMTDNNHHTL